MDNAGVQSYKISIPVAATVSLLTLPAKYLTDSVNRPKGKKKRSTETLVNVAKARLFTAKQVSRDAVITLVLIEIYLFIDLDKKTGKRHSPCGRVFRS